MATLLDVARVSGTSVGTVSRVINNSPQVSEKARARVMAAIEALDYTPNSTARSLRTARTMLAALIVPDITNGFYGSLARAISEHLAAHHYGLVLADTAESLEKERAALEQFVDRGVDGIIIAPTTTTQSISLRRDVPLLTIDRHVEGVPGVSSDNCAGAKIAVEYLTSLGHRRIGIILGPDSSSSSRDRRRGYDEALTEHGLDDEELAVSGPYTFDQGEAAMRSLLTRTNPPTAVIASSDAQAVGALHACVLDGVRVPTDVSLCGFDGTELVSKLSPELTSVRQPIDAMAERAVELLTARLHTGESIASVSLPTSLVLGGSCAPPRTSD